MRRYTGFWRKNIGLKIMAGKPKTEKSTAFDQNRKGIWPKTGRRDQKQPPANIQRMQPGVVFDRWHKSDVKAEQNHISVLEHIILTFGADEPLFLGGGHRTAGLQIIEGHHLRTDKPFLKI